MGRSRRNEPVGLASETTVDAENYLLKAITDARSSLRLRSAGPCQAVRIDASLFVSLPLGCEVPLLPAGTPESDQRFASLIVIDESNVIIVR